VLLVALRGYKILISPLFAGSCRFTPSCADYMSEAIRVHGALCGLHLGVRRLGRCHPWGPWGFDPVPVGGGGMQGTAMRAATGMSGESLRPRCAVERSGAKVQ
jgi:putative membrane protein insertion efficiency factor